MRITLMGELGDETFELIWEDGAVWGTARLVERFGDAARAAGDDPLAFIAAVERGLPQRPRLVVWPDEGASRPAGLDEPGTEGPAAGGHLTRG